ncbi:MAG: hypothetical protein LBB18_00055 [Puniceicoccales bacterium]|nr:hypothetical protein [Puniceicoccales bacterium]
MVRLPPSVFMIGALLVLLLSTTIACGFAGLRVCNGMARIYETEEMASIARSMC